MYEYQTYRYESIERQNKARRHQIAENIRGNKATKSRTENRR